MTLPIDRTAKAVLDTNLVNGVLSDAPAVKDSDDVVYNTIDELYAYAQTKADSATSVTTNGVQTLTNKTLTTPVITDPVITNLSSSVTLSGITVDGTIIALEKAVVTMAASCAVYDLVYSSATGYNKAKADAIATAKCKGMCIETGTGARQVLKHGYVKNNLWAWTVGGDLYLDPSTAGGMTQTLPSTVGQFVKIVGHAESATVIYLNIDNTYVEV